MTVHFDIYYNSTQPSYPPFFSFSHPINCKIMFVVEDLEVCCTKDTKEQEVRCI